MTRRCKDCRKWFGVRAGTRMESSRPGLRTWVIAVHLLNTGLEDQASMKLHRDLGVTQKTAWRLAHRIREAWEDNGGLLSGRRDARPADTLDRMVATVAGTVGKRLRRRELAA